MDVLEIIVPIFATIFLGVLARKRSIITAEENKGLQQFVIKFALPCVLFNSCLGCNIGIESVSSMIIVFPLILLTTFCGFKAREKYFPYHNFPFLFTAQESGMLGIPLLMTLFGADQAYRMGVLDMTQAFIAIPVMAILTAVDAKKQSVGDIVKKVLTSPLLLMSILGLALNLSGIAEYLNNMGIGNIITGTTGFLAQPVNAVILFSIGYNFTLNKENMSRIIKISAIHTAVFAVLCLVAEGILFMLPGVDVRTRWAVLIYYALPSSFLTPGLGKTQEDYEVTSGVCSLQTVLCLLIFCILAVVAV